MAHGPAERLSPRGARRRRLPSRRRPLRPPGDGHGAGQGRRASSSWPRSTRAWWRRPWPSAGRRCWDSAGLPGGAAGAKLASRPSGPACSVRSATPRTAASTPGRPARAGQAADRPDQRTPPLSSGRGCGGGRGGRRALEPRQELVVGLVPRAVGVDDDDLAKAVREREDAIAERAHDLAEHAVRAARPGPESFGPPPTPRRRRQRLVGPPRRRRRLPGPLAYYSSQHPRRDEGYRFALPSRPPRPGATGGTGSCPSGRPGPAAPAPVQGGVGAQPKAGPDL